LRRRALRPVTWLRYRQRCRHISRQSSALGRLRWRIQRGCSFKHRERLASEYDFCGDTVIDTGSHIPTRSSQSLKEPHYGRAFDQTAYNKWKPWQATHRDRSPKSTVEPLPNASDTSASTIDSRTQLSCTTTRCRRSRCQRFKGRQRSGLIAHAGVSGTAFPRSRRPCVGCRLVCCDSQKVASANPTSHCQ